ncbi:hypothetical protein [Rhizobium sp. CF080]|uniref:hypothetical protein n=1 Tax=Rhizobium sp. (strain CF080) TaxID=1144310 RepID=UPI0002719B07|nr:hypothetical protein [Rhizobium sp. CF080]
MKQLDLFVWADSKPANVVDARQKFEARAVAFVRQVMAAGSMPPSLDGKVITPLQFQHERDVA